MYISNLRNWGNESLRTDAKNCFYPIIVKGNKIIGFGEVSPNSHHPKSQNERKKDGTIFIWPIDNKGVERKWRYARQSVEEIKDILVLKTTGKEIQVLIAKDYGIYKTVWLDKRYDASEYGTKLLRKILPNCDFDFPKSLYTTYDCLYAVVGNRPRAIVLDFFAGSGTTGHAVLELNKNTKGKRQFILCTNNENGIATQVCYPRIAKVINGYKLKDGEKVAGLGGNLKYYKTDFVDGEPTDSNKKKLVDKSTEMLCLKENCFEEIAHGKHFKMFKGNGEKYLGIVYDDGGIEQFKKEAKRLDKHFMVYVFSLDESAREEEFEGVKNLVELKPIPAVILNVYRRIFK
jgi:adenine-specific DNA-methyltransferase